MSASVVTTRPVTFTDLSPEDEPGTEYTLDKGATLQTCGDMQPDGSQCVWLPWGSSQGYLLAGEWFDAATLLAAQRVYAQARAAGARRICTIIERACLIETTRDAETREERSGLTGFHADAEAVNALRRLLSDDAAIDKECADAAERRAAGRARVARG